MCGGQGDATNFYFMLCGICRVKYNTKLGSDDFLTEHELKECGFCIKCSMEIKIHNTIDSTSYYIVRGITIGRVLQYFLLKRREWNSKGNLLFFEKWFEPGSKSGIAFYNTLNPDREICYVVEDYGVGTIDPKTFGKRNDGTPIRRMEYKEYTEAREGLGELMKKNLQMMEGAFH